MAEMKELPKKKNNKKKCEEICLTLLSCREREKVCEVSATSWLTNLKEVVCIHSTHICLAW